MSDPYWTEIFDYIEGQDPTNCIVPPLRAFEQYNYKSYFEYHLYDDFDLFILHKGMETWFDCDFLKYIFASYSVLLENPVFIIMGNIKYRHSDINKFHIESFTNNIEARHKEIIENRKIIFLHVPKCAGTSLFNILKYKFKRNIYFSNIKESINFKQSLNNYNVIAGHTNLKVIQNKINFTNVTWLTILRNPIERFLSVVAHSRRKSIDNLGSNMTALRKMKLIEFMKTKNAHNELHQIYRILTSRDYKKINEYDLAEISDEILTFLAQENVYFGLQNKFEEYINNFTKFTKITLPPLYKVNIKANVSNEYYISQNELNAVSDLLSKEMEVDIKFYNRAVELYNHKYK